MANEFRRRLDDEESTAVVQPKLEPVMGALVRAYELAGIDAQTAPADSDKLEKWVQPANSLQAKCFVSWVTTGSELVAVPIFRSCMIFATGW